MELARGIEPPTGGLENTLLQNNLDASLDRELSGLSGENVIDSLCGPGSLSYSLDRAASAPPQSAGGSGALSAGRKSPRMSFVPWHSLRDFRRRFLSHSQTLIRLPLCLQVRQGSLRALRYLITLKFPTFRIFPGT
jgi:hypothetical protein